MLKSLQMGPEFKTVESPRCREYYGGSHSRGAWQYDEFMKRVGSKGLVAEIERAARVAKKESRDQITILDFGSDVTSFPAKTLVADLLDHLETLPWDKHIIRDLEFREVRKYWGPSLAKIYFLLGQYGVKLHYLGITDCPNPSDFDQPAWEHNDHKYQAINIYHTITRAQPPAKIFEKFLVPEVPIDLALAMNFFLYITPRSFEQIVSDTISRLSYGGKFIGWDIRPRYLVSRPGGIDRWGYDPGQAVYSKATQRRLSFLNSLGRDFSVKISEKDGDPLSFQITKKGRPSIFGFHHRV